MKYLEKAFKSELVVLSIGKLLQMLLLFAAIKIYTSYLSDQEIGNLILFLAVGSFFGLALINPVGSYINRKLHVWVSLNTIRENFIFFNYYVLAVSSLSIFSPVVLLMFGVGESINTLHFSLTLFIFIFFTTWNQTVIPSLNLLLHRKAFIFFTILSLIIYLLISTLFVNYIETSALYWVFGQIIGLAIGFMMALVFMAKHVFKMEFRKKNTNFSDFRNVLNFGLPLAAATLFLWILSNSFKMMVDARFGSEGLAYIGLGLGLATSLAGAVESLLMQVFHAHFYKGLSKCKTTDDRSILFQKFINDTIPPISAILFILLVISPFLMSILTHERFYDAYIFLMVGLLVEFLRVSTNIIGHAAHSEFSTKTNIPPYLVGAVFAFIAVYFSTLAENWEILILLSLLVSWTISLTLMIISAKKLLNFKFPWKELLKMILLSSPVIFFSWFFWTLANNILISVLMICLSGLIAMSILYLNYKRREINV